MKSFPSNYSDEVEVNGVTFQTEVQSVIPTPKLPFGRIPFKLGIHVTNNTDTYLHFRRIRSIEWSKILSDSDGNEIRSGSDLLRLRVRGQPYYRVLPGESSFFPLTSILLRRVYQLDLKMDIDAGGFFYFYNLQPGSYQLQLNYQNSGGVKIPKKSGYEKPSSSTNWSGSVTIPSVEFRIGC
ncbi:MAG: hypothetical protein SAJ37_09905 [Oscillatoria sp. PMC 1068.18]|nr:hypothetical protein [Oscillatoria sp. PMC 1076.18]MEC4989050.1 hypothetical protein [Oscillatoria sp. PMC 1068.18]